MTSSVINEFTLNVATVNGSGSASSNTVLAKAIFRMGVHVAPKNLFPSNIAGLPTWYIIRVSEQGWKARTGRNDVVVCMNPDTVAKDSTEVAPGGVLLVDEKIRAKLGKVPEGVTVLTIPCADLVKAHAPDPRLRKLLANMVYVGALVELLGLDPAVVSQAVHDQFSGKEKVVKLNQTVIDEGVRYARENFDLAACPFKVQARNGTDGLMLIEGNTAAAIGCLMAGCTFVGWYPITPSSSLCEEFISLAKVHRKDAATGEYRFASVQAEDELASLGLVLGAGWAGARAMTATSGPGISLMAEFAGFGYYTEIPAVVFDVQRVGPSTGMPTRTQQGDLTLCRFLSHGDTEHIVLLPAGPEELYEFSMAAFDLAEHYQTPVFVLTDLDMGMNLWESESFVYPEQPLDRGRVLDKAALEKLEQEGRVYARYGDPFGDGAPERTLPGTRHPNAPYFTRGSGHTAKAEYTEDSDKYLEVVDRLKRKIDGSIERSPGPVPVGDEACTVGIIHFGSTRYAVEEARVILAAEGIHTKELRVRALPLHDEVVEFVDACSVVYVAEQNRDGQMADILRLKVPGSAGKIRKLNYYAGMPMSADPVVKAVRAGAREHAHV